MTVEQFVDEVASEADQKGLELSKQDWIEVCDQLATLFEMSAEAAREEDEEVES